MSKFFSSFISNLSLSGTNQQAQPILYCTQFEFCIWIVRDKTSFFPHSFTIFNNQVHVPSWNKQIVRGETILCQSHQFLFKQAYSYSLIFSALKEQMARLVQIHQGKHSHFPRKQVVRDKSNSFQFHSLILFLFAIYVEHVGEKTYSFFTMLIHSDFQKELSGLLLIEV